MATKNYDGYGTHFSVTTSKDTYNLTHNTALTLFNMLGTAEVHIGAYPGGDTDTLNLISIGGSTTIYLDTFSSVMYGTLHLFNSDLTMWGGTHSHWQNTGCSVISGSGSEVQLVNAAGGSLVVERGATLKFGGQYDDIPVLLQSGGKLELPAGSWVLPEVTFGKQGQAQINELEFKNLFGATSYDIKADLLTVHSSSGDSVARVHNLTGEQLQVNQTAHGVSVVADDTPRPGMLVGHVG
jgi:hypothetical protein